MTEKSHGLAAVPRRGNEAVIAKVATAIHTSDPPDIDALFEARHERAYRAAFRVTGSHADAEDVLQTVFVRLVQSNQTPWHSNAAAYLARSGVNAALALLRRRDRDVPVEHPPDQGTEAEAALDERQNDEVAVELRRVLATINPRAAEMFVLRYFEDYENQMIAGMLGTTPNTVNVTLHRVRQTLQGLLKELRDDQSPMKN